MSAESPRSEAFTGDVATLASSATLPGWTAGARQFKPSGRLNAAIVAPAMRLLWQNTTTGDRSVWLMNGAAWDGSSYALLPSVATAWSMCASADFNADSNSDIVWQNTVTGDRSIWFMTNTTWGGSYALLPNVALAWSIAGAGDFNNDGKPDLVWQNTTTGDRSIWFMNGSTWDGTFALLPSVAPDWRIAAVADFNTDNKPDLVWQNIATGQRSIWFMNGSTWGGTYALLPTVATTWRIAGSADFDGDSKPDLVWQNLSTGQRSIWIMDGYAWGGSYALLPTIPIAWSIAGGLMIAPAAANVTFDYSRELLGTVRTLQPTVQSIDVSTHTVVVQGVDTRAPSIPFTFNWGDGSVTNGFFPQSHVYTDATHNYMPRVTAHYSTTETDSADVVARFVSPQIINTSFPAAVTVTIPTTVPVLTSRQEGYSPPSGLQTFDDSNFSELLPRSTVEYVLSQVANIEVGILDNDIERVNGEWRQVVLRDPTLGGAYSIWFSTPIAFAAAGSFFQGTPAYSSFFHEMGHNLSLNAPASFRYGGRIDGNANAIFSEAVAQMFQHSVAFELVNNASKYGLPSDLALEIANSAHASAQVIRGFYDAYIAQGKPFNTWNDPSTGVDETLGAFMTVARQFMIHAEQAKSYIGPLTRTMRLLRTFNASLAAQYAQGTNSAAANVFRSTLMVAAVSYGFQQDLRTEFRALNFPIDDAIFANLYASVP